MKSKRKFTLKPQDLVSILLIALITCLIIVFLQYMDNGAKEQNYQEARYMYLNCKAEFQDQFAHYQNLSDQLYVLGENYSECEKAYQGLSENYSQFLNSIGDAYQIMGECRNFCSQTPNPSECTCLIIQNNTVEK